MKKLSLASITVLASALIFAAVSFDDTAQANGPELAENEFGILKVAEGVETTFYSCTACHSEMIIAQQGLPRKGWDEMLVWMVEEQGMSEIEEPDRTVILDYLSTHYNEDSPNFPK